jgi:NADPH-dependent glutamate synthase beta subunit-like oxidoreductase
MQMVEVEGSEFRLKADLVILAMGLTGPRRTGMIQQSGVAHDAPQLAAGKRAFSSENTTSEGMPAPLARPASTALLRSSPVTVSGE